MKILALEFLKAGGKLTPLLIPSHLTNGTAIFNPSVFVDKDNKVLMNLRHCQYTLYHSEKKRFEHEWGPLLYLNPENDISLTTTNYLCELEPENYSIIKFTKIDTSQLDVEPLWEFIGLEDARVVRWDNKLYLSGVRRDTTTNGVGRMELSEIVDGKEVDRWRIPAPDPDDSYCEKNWMPVIDLPFHYVKWCTPTQVVHADPISKTCKTVALVDAPQTNMDYRGGSQVIRVGDYYIALVHTVRLFQSEAGRKDGIYRHAFLVWDLNWNTVKRTEEFTFMNADIEFCAGMAEHNGKILMSFGFSDNAAYVLSLDTDKVMEFIFGD